MLKYILAITVFALPMLGILCSIFIMKPNKSPNESGPYGSEGGE